MLPEYEPPSPRKPLLKFKEEPEPISEENESNNSESDQPSNVIFGTEINEDPGRGHSVKESSIRLHLNSSSPEPSIPAEFSDNSSFW